jgi:hypothetical protein
MNRNLALSVIAAVASPVITTTMMAAESSYATESLRKKPSKVAEHLDVPIATSGESTYIAWWADETGNDEVMFRSSNDSGASFTDKINLSNTINTESQDVEIAAEGDNVIVTWWERNSTSDEPVIRTSTDNGQTFGPLLKLAANGTISNGKQTQ